MRSTRSQRSVTALLCVLVCTILFCPTGASAQFCNAVSCGPTVAGGSGDINGDGSVDALDLSALISYCFSGGAPPASLCNAEINGWCNRYFPCEPTLGDIAQLINVLFFGGASANCLAAIDLQPSNLTTTPGGFFVRRGTNVNRTVTMYAWNRNVFGRRLFGYTVPLRVIGSGVTINSVNVTSQYTGPGNVWTQSGSVNRPGNRVFGYSVPDNNLTSVLIPAGQRQQIMQITINYTCWRWFGLIRILPYMAAPSEIPVYSESGEFAPGRALEANLEEGFFEMDTDVERIPATTDLGRGILMALIILAGLVMASRAWKAGLAPRPR